MPGSIDTHVDNFLVMHDWKCKYYLKSGEDCKWYEQCKVTGLQCCEKCEECEKLSHYCKGFKNVFEDCECLLANEEATIIKVTYVMFTYL